MAVIYRQEILQDIAFFTSAPKAQFYNKLFLNVDLSDFPESTAKTGRNRFSKRALLRTFIVMKCECFSCITDLVDYLNNNLIIAHYCGSGVHTASNQHNERKFEYYWGYKNHILVDCITGLPIYELTTSADVSDSSIALDILSQTNNFLSVDEYTFLADKGYDIKAIYNTVKELYRSDCVIPINKRNTKDLDIQFVKQNLLCTRTKSFPITAEHVRNTAVR